MLGPLRNTVCPMRGQILWLPLLAPTPKTLTMALTHLYVLLHVLDLQEAFHADRTNQNAVKNHI